MQLHTLNFKMNALTKKQNLSQIIELRKSYRKDKYNADHLDKRYVSQKECLDDNQEKQHKVSFKHTRSIDLQEGHEIKLELMERFLQKCSIFSEVPNAAKIVANSPVKNYAKNQYVYQIGDQIACLYFIIEGEIELETNLNDCALLLQQIQLAKKKQKKAHESIKSLRRTVREQLLFTTQHFSNFSFFGDEQIIFKAPSRNQNAKCLSLRCTLLQIPIEKIQKLLFFNEFKECLQKSSESKFNQRSILISNYVGIHNLKNSQNIFDKASINQEFQSFNKTIYQKRFKTQSAPFKGQKNIGICLKRKQARIIHGNSIHQSQSFRNKTLQKFSMLETNKETYEVSLKKFRNYSQNGEKLRKKKERAEGSILHNRSLKTIWKVLNLEKVLHDSEEKMISNEEGLKYFDAHLRYMRHMINMKSYRPKTITSNFKIKNQYIEYLQKLPK